MVNTNLCILVLWAKVVSALEGLSPCTACEISLYKVILTIGDHLQVCTLDYSAMEVALKSLYIACEISLYKVILTTGDHLQVCTLDYSAMEVALKSLYSM